MNIVNYKDIIAKLAQIFCLSLQVRDELKMKKLVFATNNKHKLEEVRAVLKGKFEILGLNEIGCYEDIPETALTLEGNALIKANYVYETYGFDCFADDTGLEVEALNGEPGVYSARYGGVPHDALRNIEKLLNNLGNNENRNAQFRTIICLIQADNINYFEGIVKGQIIAELKGDNGFGYDPVFVPEGFSQTFAELGSDVKNNISHRALAVNELVKFLEK